MDGNDSLKHVIHQTLDNDNDDSVGVLSELPTGQLLTSDCYLSHSFVDQFRQDSPPAADNKNAPGENLCKGQWRNMDDTKTKKAWGIYDETGVFVVVCCYGFCLLITDMVQSVEFAKYSLAMVARLLNVFGDNLGGRYDIGCQFKITLENSSLVPLLSSLTTYIKGLGLKDLEMCECTFSKSNSLASALCYASVFHCQQAINSYFDHNDNFEVYGNLSNFLHSNYKEALDILANSDATLSKVMQDLGVRDDSVFECWLDEEKAYLKGLTREPEEETLQMEYWQSSCQSTRHLKQLHNISMLPGFSGTLVPGLSMHMGLGGSASMPDTIPANILADPIPLPKLTLPVHADTHEDLDEEKQKEEIAEEASRNLQDVLLIMNDFVWLRLLDDADVDE
ncbi:hypothetical protein EV702DRAFT_1193520 [Suillus placidus]|uniref:Uncharacterized protein n=1 Tax=Suillus placidus TaxID=48579 RepID=A0A9P7D6Y2_9AGAM|nr:hypothetical protein EV702DRAFT_1193520 [Suillus placidus]